MPPTPPPAEPAGSTATASGATGSAADTPTVVRRRDYRPLPWKVAALELVFDLHEDHALVTATASYELAPGQAGGAPPLVLDGEDLELVEIALDGTPLDADDYILTPERMTLDPVRLAGGDEFSLRVVTRLRPQDNRSMEGLYRSGGLFCTQMEAEGFRKVTYFPDRPDALTVWTTTLEADATRYPVLLGNGPRTAYAPLPGGRHRATFVDPVPKPSYLFALVAGDLDKVEGSFTTMSGRDVRLCVWTERGLSARGRHALDSLIAAMAWDERTYGREYDLPEFHIVAVSDFNMGAMENKGLNLFNSNAVLADAATRTDADFLRIEGIVAHEYFHNWSGNRVTCRDWFQLSLKEGFTVFRDQTFSEDTGGAAVQRIQDVRNLREAQFPEDAGPQAHPVRPDEYIAIDNFYTRTVYEKGAEVIRMQRALLGPDAFRRGTDLYFERHDGQAVTCDDFVAALQDASGVDLEAFKACWYAEAGTPRLKTTGRWDAAAGTYTLAVEQSCPPTPGRPTKPPFVIPLALGLVGPDGRDLPLVLQGESASASPAADADGAVTRVLTLDAPRHEFTFTGLKGAGGAALSEAPVPSLLRGFSAPVVLQSDLDDDDLARLAAHDADAFNRWEAFQTLAMRELLRLTHAAQAGGEVSVGGPFARVFEALLEGAADGSVAPLFAAETLELPSERTLNDRLAVADPEAVHTARESLRQQLGAAQQQRLTALYERQRAATGAAVTDAVFDRAAVGPRALAAAALSWLAASGAEPALDFAEAQFAAADNMTDELAALDVLAASDGPRRERALAAFRAKWDAEPLVLDKWFACQVAAPRPSVPDELAALLDDPAFSHDNPNKVRAVFRTLGETPIHFHRRDGKGYALLAEELARLDGRNPILAARLSGAFDGWRHMDPARQDLMRGHMDRLLQRPGCSPNLYEMLSKALS